MWNGYVLFPIFQLAVDQLTNTNSKVIMFTSEYEK